MGPLEVFAPSTMIHQLCVWWLHNTVLNNRVSFDIGASFIVSKMTRVVSLINGINHQSLA